VKEQREEKESETFEQDAIIFIETFRAMKSKLIAKKPV
jgi:hypothetical protein